MKLFVIFLSLSVFAYAVDRSKFRTCTDTGFCRKYRSLESSDITYKVDLSSITTDVTGIRGQIISANHLDPLVIRISVYQEAVRVKISEAEPRWQPLDLLRLQDLRTGSYKLIASIASASEKAAAKLPQALSSLSPDAAYIAVCFGDAEPQTLAIHASPMKLELYRGNLLQVVANERSLMHFEQTNTDADATGVAEPAPGVDGDALVGDLQDGVEDRHGGKEVVDYGEDGLAVYADGTREVRKSAEDEAEDSRAASGRTATGDSFGGHTDTQPLGPRSVGLDFSFPFAQHVYGIPEHTSPLSLPTTARGSAGISPKYQEPYRLYNLDVFEYELDEPMALYGHIPFLIAHGASPQGEGRSAGMFWFNPSETFVDISDAKASSSSGPHKQTRWLSESGEIDFFLFSGPTPADVFSHFTLLSGRQQLPPLFALGYHQCRWNYRDEKDVAYVEGTFEKLDYPVDVIWLDIEHTDGKRYFTWDKTVFPTPLEMQANISAHGRRMVTIIDPHIKRDDNYHIHKEATSKGLYVKDKSGADFDGWCWPGSSSYLDFTNPRVRAWWVQQFSLKVYVGSTMDLFTWNDMNEPSVFNGPEVSMPKDNKNLEGVEHREWHNLYGLYMQSATADGLTARTPSPTAHKQRPFVLSRAFWAGSQRYGAIWTGDNKAEWSHLKIAAPMLLSINIAGLSFAGADVGGFFGDCSAELFTRWYQAGAFTPFFRGHAHHDTKRREPWVFGEPYTSILRDVAMLRYSLLPFWYSVFYEAHTRGLPVMRAMFVEFPDLQQTFAMDDQWMVGSSLLVKPVTDPETFSIDVFLPPSTGWYDFYTLAAIKESGAVRVDAPLSKIPVFVRAGSVIPRKLRLRRSSKLMFHDPYTLIVAPDASGHASGTLYMDDEITLAHQDDPAAHVYRRFTLTDNILSSRKAAEEEPSGSVIVSAAGEKAQEFKPKNSVERIDIANQPKKPTRVTLRFGLEQRDLVFFHDGASHVITIKKPDVPAAEDWDIAIDYLT